MELEQNFDEFFALRAQKYITRASRDIRTASNNLKQIDTNLYSSITYDIVNKLEIDLNRIYRQITDAESKLIELRRELMQ